ncbi:MAG: phosphatidylserine/phosphatidylglycerophosphate/cardiolipin synthase family protein [Candidatus Njordarchaeota archaeon]
MLISILIFYGPVIGGVISKLMRNSEKRIYIMSQTIGHIGTIHVKDRKIYVDLLDILKAKAKKGIEVSLILKDPDNLNISDEKRNRYLELLDDLAIAGVKIFFCWHMHMKIVILDNVAIVGSANLTLTGLRGLGEVALVIEDKKTVDSLVRAHESLRRRNHEVCLLCDRREKKLCGYYSL